MATKVKDIEIRLKSTVDGLQAEYERAKNLYDKSGLDANLKENSLTTMATALQMQSVAIQNYANWKHVLREDKKLTKS